MYTGDKGRKVSTFAQNDTVYISILSRRTGLISALEAKEEKHSKEESAFQNH